MRTKEEEARHQLALKAQSTSSSPVKSLSKPLLVPSGSSLSFKKKEHSTSGDDKAIEKKAIEWLNAHLSGQGIVVDDVVKGLGEGLNLIYALEVNIKLIFFRTRLVLALENTTRKQKWKSTSWTTVLLPFHFWPNMESILK